jgi:hypothetical protein
MFAGPTEDRCWEREGPAWGPEGVFVVVPGRRRDLAGLVTSPRSSNDGDDVDEGLIVLASGCRSFLLVEACGRPLV